MRAARLIKMVLLLQSRPSMTAAELARELEVSERTVTRDAQALSEAGVPVYADRGRVGGYRLVGGYRTRLTGLARGEAEVLFLSGVPGALREMGLEDAASAARLKVSAALLPSLRDAPRTAAQRFHLDAPAWFQEPQTPPLLPAVADAVWDDRPIRARYRRGEAEVERELEPYGLVLKAGVWYMCARAVAEGAGGGAGAADRGAAGTTGSGAPGTTGSGAARSGTAGTGTAGASAAGWDATGARAAGSGAADAGAAGPGAAGSGTAGTGTAGASAAGWDATGTGAAGSGAADSGAVGSVGGGAGAVGVGSFRMYRIDRFVAVEALEGLAGLDRRFERDQDFDLPVFWAEQAERFARSIMRAEVVVRLSATGVDRLPYVVDPVAARDALAVAEEADAQGWVTVTLGVESEEVAHTQLTALGPEAEVLAPRTLRRRFAEDAQRLARAYGM
ncbi:YafY family protein [Streptomyces griseus]|nr:WYL domain-containing protein [Streptomyces griseus]